MSGSSQYGSITRGVSILRCLADGMNRLADLSATLNLGKATVHRLLKALESTGFVIQEPRTRRYYLGPLFVDLVGKPVAAHQALIVNSHTEMARLRAISKETVVLHIPIGLNRVCVSEFESEEIVRYTSGIGSVCQIYVGSVGKILISQFDQHETNFILNNIKLVAIGPNTITNEKHLRQEIEAARRHGYATSIAERIPDAASISVPVQGYICPVALSILGPKDRFGPKMMEVLPEMKLSAERIVANISECLGSNE